MRRIVAGNWKMNLAPAETISFLEDFRPGPAAAGDDEPRIMIFPPALSLSAALNAERDDRVELGVQNVHWEASGAFTGEVSPGMAAAAGATLSLVGHSERRQLFGEDDATVARKTVAILEAGLTPVVCVGETLDERKAGQLTAVLQRQLGAVLDALAAAGVTGGGEGDLPRWILAYEPVWAIGTGETATPDDASEAHAILRAQLSGHGAGVGGAIPILYGGSVKPGNAAELMNAPDVDGVLVGGASLKPTDFAQIVQAGRR